MSDVLHSFFLHSYSLKVHWSYSSILLCILGDKITSTTSHSQQKDISQDSSSTPILVITFVLGDFVRVIWRQLLYCTLTQDRATSLQRLTLLISCWLLRFVLSICRLTNFTSISSQLLDSYLLQDFSSSPNLVITFLFGNIVWESTVANNCIGHWH